MWIRQLVPFEQTAKRGGRWSQVRKRMYRVRKEMGTVRSCEALAMSADRSDWCPVRSSVLNPTVARNQREGCDCHTRQSETA